MGSTLLKSIILIIWRSLIRRLWSLCFFNKISLYRYFIEKKHKLHLSLLLCCNHTCYCVNMVSVTSASRYITSASCYYPCYQSRSSMYIRGLIPLNFWELAEAVPIDFKHCNGVAMLQELRTSKGDYRIKQCLSSSASLKGNNLLQKGVKYFL